MVQTSGQQPLFSSKNIGDQPQALTMQRLVTSVTVAAAATGIASIRMPNTRDLKLAGYGYSWYPNSVYSVSTENKQFPEHADQEGSLQRPYMFSIPFDIRAGGLLKLSVANNDAIAHRYEVVFVILTSEIIDTAQTVNVPAIDSYNRTPTHSAVTVGSTSTSIIAANHDRKGLLLINDSDETMYINLAGGTAVASTGIRINPNGGSYEMSIELGNNCTAAVTGICASGSKTMIVTEFE